MKKFIVKGAILFLCISICIFLFIYIKNRQNTNNIFYIVYQSLDKGRKTSSYKLFKYGKDYGIAYENRDSLGLKMIRQGLISMKEFEKINKISTDSLGVLLFSQISYPKDKYISIEATDSEWKKSEVLPYEVVVDSF
ncbi:hypothetical protein Q2T41_11250 [Maribacter confluentis]|uniref:Uncharacterized protein n=1 Tax=Maribacter confluentis TaxID=1656093 RepID=A0ABT8RQQ8_9FLAO|nr:hypothetical protein [Maribacter confluentis]MDO1513233.1 hypothetical protein [Maribacter confluentis]